MREKIVRREKRIQGKGSRKQEIGREDDSYSALFRRLRTKREAAKNTRAMIILIIKESLAAVIKKSEGKSVISSEDSSKVRLP